MVHGKRFLFLLAASLLFAGCGDDATTPNGTTGSGGSAGQGGQGGEGGMGGGGMGGGSASHGPPGQDFVNAGNVSKSPSYRLEWSLGQSTQNQSKSTSTGYRLQGGLIGANGSLP